MDDAEPESVEAEPEEAEPEEAEEAEPLEGAESVQAALEDAVHRAEEEGGWVGRRRADCGGGEAGMAGPSGQKS